MAGKNAHSHYAFARCVAGFAAHKGCLLSANLFALLKKRDKEMGLMGGNEGGFPD